MARDTRESWWRTTPRNLSWSVEDFEPDSLGRRVADQAEVENFRYQARAIQAWLKEMDGASAEWRRAAGATDSLVRATAEQTADPGEILEGAEDGDSRHREQQDGEQLPYGASPPV